MTLRKMSLWDGNPFKANARGYTYILFNSLEDSGGGEIFMTYQAEKIQNIWIPNNSEKQ